MENDARLPMILHASESAFSRPECGRLAMHTESRTVRSRVPTMKVETMAVEGDLGAASLSQ